MDIDNLDDLDVPLPDEFRRLPTFVVGGAVRDTLRCVSSSDLDLMVAEVSPDEMRERGFREIDSPNNDTFGVFQDSLGREVAIAREEVSTGGGHDDFDVTPVSPDIEATCALRRDLKRRDLTVNAMALDARHDIFHDPHDGLRDLKDGVIRAVSPETTFKEDPLRILRAARFAARLDAEIEDTTKGAMWESTEMLHELPSERIRIELEKTLVQADEPSRFFRILDEVGALKKTFPELHSLKGVPAGPSNHHLESADMFE